MLSREELLDIVKLMKVSRKRKNQEDAPLKIAVEGSYSIQFFVQIFRYVLQQSGIEANIYEGEYNGIAMDVLNETSMLYQSNPKFVLLLTDYRDIKEFPRLMASTGEVEAYVEKTISFYESLWTNLNKISGVHVLQTNFVLPNVNQLGNMECNVTFSQTYFYRRINEELTKRHPSYVTMIDLEGLASDIGKRNWFDNTAYFSYKAGYKLDYTGLTAELFVKQIEAVLGKGKKCLVLDLDNTLWGGAVGELGWGGIELNPNDPTGEAFCYFQTYVKELKERGVILAVCSKNDEENAKQPFLHRKEMKLKLEDISCFVANWNDKADNIAYIAEYLNIGIDSLVFFDDNPVERERIRQVYPEVCVVEVPTEPENYVNALYDAHAFEWMQLTEEDIERTNTYVQNQKRQELNKVSGDYNTFLRSLEMVGALQPIHGSEIQRFTQLINKSNQFNLTTKRYTEHEIQAFCNAQDYKCLGMYLSDKFGTYGIISCVILKKVEQYCLIDTWLMSCRVLKRDVERFVFQGIVEAAHQFGCTTLVGEYIPTKKNGMVEHFYTELGFTKVQDAVQKEKLKSRFGIGDIYLLESLELQENNTHIRKG